jgi:hypothetical protein
MVAVYLALALALLLNAASVHEAVARMAPGPVRGAALAVVVPIHDLSSALYLDQPNLALRWWLGRELPDRAAATAPVAADPPVPAPPPPPAAIDHGAQGVSGYGPLAPPPPPSPRRISADDPLVLLVVGDSLLSHVGPALRRELEGTGLARVTVDWRHSTGMVRPDYFDWTEHLRTVLALDAPDAVLLMLGANDNQGFDVRGQVYDQRTDAWKAEYERRVSVMMEAVTSHRVRLCWVGLPVMRAPKIDTNAGLINAAIQRQAAAHPRVSYHPSRSLFLDDRGGYASYLLDREGVRYRARRNDGIHFTVEASEVLARRLAADLVREWDLAASPTGDR